MFLKLYAKSKFIKHIYILRAKRLLSVKQIFFSLTLIRPSYICNKFFQQFLQLALFPLIIFLLP